MAESSVLEAAALETEDGFSSGQFLENVTEEFVERALDSQPAFTITFGDAGMSFDVSLAFGHPFIDRAAGHHLNVRGIVYEAQAAEM